MNKQEIIDHNKELYKLICDEINVKNIVQSYETEKGLLTIEYVSKGNQLNLFLEGKFIKFL